ncbi:MAG: helix-turn-helix transcriptional regulator [Deltaproteobacteria bacterium]|nr:helix-turn-helix transcriptional regulator [Deltaproteobacteria bacterium]
MESLGQKVKYFRKIKGWSQEYLARNIGVSLNTVQRWEMERNEPSPLAREKLMALFREVLDGDQLKLL